MRDGEKRLSWMEEISVSKPTYDYILLSLPVVSRGIPWYPEITKFSPKRKRGYIKVGLLGTVQVDDLFHCADSLLPLDSRLFKRGLPPTTLHPPRYRDAPGHAWGTRCGAERSRDRQEQDGWSAHGGDAQ